MTHLRFHSIKTHLLTLFCVLALCFSPLTISATKNSTAELKKLAVTHKDIDAQYFLGYRYEMGKTVNQNFRKAIHWYKKAAEKNHKDAQYRLGVLYFKQKQYANARYWLVKRAEEGHADAQYYFARTYRYSLGTKEQTSTARKWFTKAADQGHALAQYELGLQFQKGIGAKKNQKMANKWFNLAADQGNKDAKTNLAKITPAKSNNNSPKTFIQKNLRLARNGDVGAQYALGKAYLDGKNTKTDYKKSYYWLNKAAKKNHIDAQFALGLIYIDGNTAVGKDLSKAKVWLTKAADKNHKNADAELDRLAKLIHNQQQENLIGDLLDTAMKGDIEQQYELGMRYLLGYKTSVDYQQAIYWLNKAATQNHALAQYQLANQYIKGNFVNQSVPLAIHFFTAAAKQNFAAAKLALKYYSENGFKDFVLAEQGDKEAQYQLATSYLNNANQMKQKQGLEWLQLAADQSHPLALLELGKLYRSGTMLGKDDVKAFQAYTKAAELNNAEAQHQLSKLYRLGIGTPQNALLASHWLNRAASQGHEEAQKSLQFSEI